MIRLWNMLVEFGFLSVFSIVLANFKNGYEHEKKLARTDALTGAYNKWAFESITKDEIYRAGRYKRPITAAYIDVDNFKKINDTYGHDMGDQVLKSLVRIIKNNLRAFDIVARIGGDEFIIILPETDARAARVVFEKLQRTYKQFIKKKNWLLSFSIGVITFVHPLRAVKTLVTKTDKLMYQAKKEGKNRIKYESA